jgi:hypothetical protein
MKNYKLILENWNKFVDEEKIEESSNQRGFEYEDEVIAVLNSEGVSGDIKSGAGASAAAADADIKINDQIYKIEVKLDKGAQMGGTSLRYYPERTEDGKYFSIVSKSVEEDTIEMMEESLTPIIPDLDVFLEFVGVSKLPATIERDKWAEAVSLGLLKPLNVKIERTTRFITNHYKKKGIDYIQIGGAGLFHLAENPANLPVPKLEGNINIELRPGRSGSKTRKDGTKVVGAGIRVQGRLKFKGTSPYTLDDPKSVREMLAAIEQPVTPEQNDQDIDQKQ